MTRKEKARRGNEYGGDWRKTRLAEILKRIKAKSAGNRSGTNKGKV